MSKNLKKRLMAFLLALCLFVSIPFTVFAKTVQYESGTIQFVMRSGSNTEQHHGTIPFYFVASNIKQTTLQYCDLIFTEKFSLQKNEQLSFDIVLGAKRYSNMSATAFIYSDNGDFKFLLDYNYNSEQKLTGSFLADKDYNNCSVVIRCNSFTYGDYNEANKLNAYMEVLVASYSIDSEESGFFENVGKWFTELFQKIKDLSTNISNGFSSIVSSVGDWFSSLVDDLQQWFDDLGKWFSELGTKLQQWFDDVGQWFSDLSDNIKQWFIDLGDKFQKWIDDFNLSFTNWWNDIKEWFKNLFIPEDGYFDTFVQTFANWFLEHFGALYQTVDIISNIIDKIFNSVGTSIDYIEYPTITVPVVDITILNGGRFYWSTITENQFFAFVFRTFQTVCSAIMIFAVVQFARKTLNQILGIEEE